MNKSRHVAAPFEVSRHVTFYAEGYQPAEDTLFTGRVAREVLREKWTEIRGRLPYDHPLQKEPHPQLSGMSVVLLHATEVHTALLEDYDAEDQPLYHRAHTMHLRRRLGLIVKQRKVLEDVPSATQVDSLTGPDDGLQRIALSYEDESGILMNPNEPLASLWKERMLCLEALRAVTGYKDQELLGPAIMIARLPVSTPEGIDQELVSAMQYSIDEIVADGRNPLSAGTGFPPYQLQMPELIERSV